MASPRLEPGVKFERNEGDIKLCVLRDGLAKAECAVISLFVSRSLVPLGREAALLSPKDSSLDKELVKLHQSKSRDFGELLNLNPPQELPDAKCKQLVASVVPRDNIRRDETRQLVYSCVLATLDKAVAYGDSVAIECVDGNKLFAIPQQQIAETIVEAVVAYSRNCNKSEPHIEKIVLCSSSNSLSSMFSGVLKAYCETPTETVANFSVDDASRAYGERMRLIYNSAGSSPEAKHSVYDVFCALERNFGKERSPALLSQIKKFLREIHGATDADLEDAFQRRKKECSATLPELLDSVRLNPSQFFRQLCCPRTGPLQFCREAIVDSVREFHKTRPFVTDEEELNAYLTKYCGIDEVPPGELGNSNSKPSLHQSAKDTKSKHLSEGRVHRSDIIGAAASTPEIKPVRPPPKPPTERDSRSPIRANSMIMNPNDSNDLRRRGNSSASTTPLRGRVRSASGGVATATIPLRDISNDVPPELSKFSRMVVAGNTKLINALMNVTDSADLDRLAAPITRIFAFAGDALSFMRHGIQHEVSMTVTPSTLLRSNSLVTKAMTFTSRLVGKQYIVDLVKPLIDRIVADPSNLEVDATRLKDPRLIDKNRDKLKSLVTQLVDDMRASSTKLPIEFRKICFELKSEVGRKFPAHVNVAIAGYLCLRIINPAVAAPETLGIIPPEAITPEIRRGCILVSKIFQNIANNLEFKEQFMTHFNAYVRERFDAVQQFLSEAAVIVESAPSNPVSIALEQTVQDITALRAYCKNALPKLQKAITEPEFMRDLEEALL